MERGEPDAGFVEGSAAAKFSQLCVRHGRAKGGGRVAGAGWAALAKFREVSSGMLRRSAAALWQIEECAHPPILLPFQGYVISELYPQAYALSCTLAPPRGYAYG